jgi:hypothetical protein
MRLRYLIVVTMMIVSACSDSTTPTTPTPPSPPAGSVPVRVFGRVIDFATHSGVAGASIDFYISGIPVIATSVVTDATGSYSVTLSRGVRYNPRINGPDVDSNRGTIIPLAKENEEDYLINGGTCIVIYGTVRDATSGEPLSGASVVFRSPPVLTGADGFYRIDLGCPSPGMPWQGTGTTFMTVTRAGYVNVTPFGTRAEFIPGVRTQRIDIAMQPAS